MRQGDIVWLDFDPTVGHEQAGRRPALVVSADDFNRITGLAVVVPITNGGGFATRISYAVALAGRGLKTTGVVRCDQPRTVDWRRRGATLIEAAPADLVADALARVLGIFE
jgi:mRNA-degrading endonuclease toxin of MazEF toxin-antitoxin module